ncbi:hypothetical protein NFI96_001731 [Prochilodus magdalenae]|nr:hypothetical protein NFI96_001731 [Prochilodus magdalenae]
MDGRCKRKPPSRQPFHPESSPKSASACSARSCYRCGSSKHLANAKNCPAARAKCKTCQKMGHFARVCRSTHTHSVREVEMPEYTILYLQDLTPGNKIICPVTIQTPAAAAKLDLIVDTGSCVSILPKATYLANFNDTPLQPPKARLVTYSRDPIAVLGCLPATVSIANVSCSADIFIVKFGSQLLGLDLKGLHLRIEGQRAVPSTPASVSQGPALVGQLSTPSLLSGILGCAKGFVHKVKLSESVVPVRQKLRRLPLSVRDAVSAELEHLLKEGIIERVDASPWVSPIVVTQKKNGGIRMCVDFREPNKAIVVDCYPLPHIDELLSRLRGASVFSTIDLQSAYHQVLLHPDSRDLTAFITHEGLFRFCRVPYGLASAPAAFQKMMSSILQGLSNVANYLNDIIIWGRTSDEHECYLQAVLKCLKDAGLQLNVSKCCFHQTKLRFLGHTLTAQGIQPDEEHLAAILHAPAPADAAKLRSFLGLLSWFNKIKAS